MNTVYGYLRVSTGRQALSLEAQAEAIKRWYAYEHPDNAPPLLLCDPEEEVSGRKEFARRPVGCALFRRVQSGDCIVFTKLDRGFRNAKDLLVTLDLLRQRKVRFVFLDLKVDTDTPTGRFFLAVMGAVAEWEREMISHRTKAGLDVLRAKGKPICRFRWGYKVIGDKPYRKEVIDEDQIKLGRRIVEWKDRGWSWQEIVDHLKEQGVTNPRTRYKRGNNKNWSIRTIRLYYEYTQRWDAAEGQGPAQGQPGP